MLKQALIVFGVLLAFGCADVQRTDRQFDFDSSGCGCNECPDGLSEGKADSGDSSDVEWQHRQPKQLSVLLLTLLIREHRRG